MFGVYVVRSVDDKPIQACGSVSVVHALGMPVLCLSEMKWMMMILGRQTWMTKGLKVSGRRVVLDV